MNTQQVAVAKKVSPSINQLAFRMLKQLRASEGPKNLLISPISLFSSSSMLRDAYDGKACKELTKLLGTERINDSIVHQAISCWSHGPYQKPDSTLICANELFLRSDVTPTDSYRKTLNEVYNARCIQLPSNHSNESEAVNRWVSEQTNGQIQSTIERISSTDRVLIMNAVYFRAAWQTKFDPKRTQNLDFKPENGGPRTVPMMMAKEGTSFSYSSTNEADMIRLNYAANEFEFALVIPNEKTTMTDFLKTFDLKAFDKMIETSIKQKGEFELPRFEQSLTYKVLPLLKGVGVKEPLKPQPKVHGLKSQLPLRISQFVHKTWIKLDEEGTEAAAVSESHIGCAKSEPLEIDRPFLYAILHIPTDTIVFLGICNDPSRRD